MVGTLLSQLIKYWETSRHPRSEEENANAEHCRRIVARLLAAGPSLHPLKEHAATLSATHLADQIRRLEGSLESDPSVRERSVVTKHIRNAFQEGELNPAGASAKFAQIRTEGGRTVSREVDHYNLDVILGLLSRQVAARHPFPYLSHANPAGPSAARLHAEQAPAAGARPGRDGAGGGTPGPHADGARAGDGREAGPGPGGAAVHPGVAADPRLRRAAAGGTPGGPDRIQGPEQRQV